MEKRRKRRTVRDVGRFLCYAASKVRRYRSTHMRATRDASSSLSSERIMEGSEETSK